MLATKLFQHLTMMSVVIYMLLYMEIKLQEHLPQNNEATFLYQCFLENKKYQQQLYLCLQLHSYPLFHFSRKFCINLIRMYD